MFKKIKEYYKKKRLERKQELNLKKFRIWRALTNHIYDYNRMHNVTDISAHYIASYIMKLQLRTDRQVERSYKKLLRQEGICY